MKVVDKKYLITIFSNLKTKLVNISYVSMLLWDNFMSTSRSENVFCYTSIQLVIIILGVDDNHCWYPRTLRDNNCYLVNKTRKTWSEANVSCVDDIMELVSIKNAAETDAVKSLYPYSNLFWIGAYQSDGTWEWIDGKFKNSNLKTKVAFTRTRHEIYQK